MTSRFVIRWRLALAFTCLIASLQASTNERIQSGEALTEAGLNDRAILLYQEILRDLQSAEIEAPAQLHAALQARFLLAHALNEEGRYEEALKILEADIKASPPLPEELEKIRQNSVYLCALAYKNLQQYDKAKSAMLNYLTTLPLQKEAQFELALINFLEGSLDEAGSQFSSIAQGNAAPRLRMLAQLYLARIALAINNPSNALALLNDLEQQISEKDDLYFELSYLKGEACFLTQEFQKASLLFEHALPKRGAEKCSWYSETLYRLGWSYLHLGEAPLKDQRSSPEAFFLKAEATFQKLLDISPDEKNYLALGQCYLARAARLRDEKAYSQAEALLSNQALFSSREARDQALLLRADAASSYDVRDKFYRLLTQSAHSNSPFFAKSWYLRALNDFEEGKSLFQSGCTEKGIATLENSASGFRRAFELLENIDKPRAASALKYSALAIGYQDGLDASLTAFSVLDELINKHAELLYALDCPDEIFYLHGFFAARLSQFDESEKFSCDACSEPGRAEGPAYFTIARQSLLDSAKFPNSKFGSLALMHLGTLQYLKGEYHEAEGTFLQLIRDFPSSDLVAEAWFWSARCSDNLPQRQEASRQRRHYVFENFPNSPFAAEAFFTLYTYQEYLQGDRNAIKHLHNFIPKFPDSPLLIQAFFLIGLDYKRDRKTPEGKWIRKKSWTEAIDAFQNAETLFDDIAEKGLIPAGQIDYYATVYYRAILERAMANLAIAEESSGAKRQIYLEYAEEVFKYLIHELATLQNKYAKRLFQGEAFPSIYEESCFGLAHVYIKGENDREAAQILSEMLNRYSQSGVTRGYYLSRVWYEQAGIARRSGDFSKALIFFKQAEDCAKGNVLSTDQRLDLWLQQSHCQRELGKFDEAILILSKAINDDAVSSLRLKAMYLRAEIYELQKRPELARKQLDSLAKKGGNWAQKAKEKLETEYGY